MFERQKRANAYVMELCNRDSRLMYVDTVTPMIGTDGKPIAELFVKDGLHLSEKGYAVWNDVVRKALKKLDSPRSKR
jgi:lysophospholipase L1-like esterase